MSQLFAERLKSARMMNGLSLQELSDKLENRITRQAIHKYENGEVIPDSEMLNFLCEALGVRPDYFTHENLVELGPISFRKIEKLPTKEQSSIIERTKEVLQRYIELEEIMGINKPFEQPLIIPSITSQEDAEQAANNIRIAWNLYDNPIPNVIELLEDKNIKVILLNAGDEFDGLQTWINGKKIPVIVLNTGKLKSSDRIRFSAFHELGHLLLPLDGIPEKLAEKYCHAFAGAMLLPGSTAKKEMGEKRNKISIQELGLIKQQYGISLQAIIYRLWDLDIISAYYKSYYYQYIIQMGWKVEEPYKYEGKEKSSRFDQLLFRALSEELISLSKAASLNNMKLSEFRTKTMAVE
ncbi:MAG: XRE family transcriptional regulator [Bacteroidia bacterium]|nr:XRE family transcriptional regulator [Bacteroidia bacterium]